MNESIFLIMVLFDIYLFLPTNFFGRFFSGGQETEFNASNSTVLFVPEDSVLRRHYITQLRAEIENELYPRPTDFNLQRHYDAIVAAELEIRLSKRTTLSV